MGKRRMLSRALLLGMAMMLVLSSAAFGAEARQMLMPKPIDELPPFGELVADPELIHKKKSFVEGIEDEWFEYIPASYTGEEPVPLVIVLHGGAGTGDGTARSTSWYLLAEREGFIVVYPTAFRLSQDIDAGVKHTWATEFDSDDMYFLEELIKEVQREYNIDAGRIYMTGFSMGDLMTTNFGRKNPHLLAGIAVHNGPEHIYRLTDENGEYLPTDLPLPVYQNRGLGDRGVSGIWEGGIFKGRVEGIREEYNDANKEFWLTNNGNTALPQFRIRGVHNYIIYSDGEADLLYHEIVDRGHSQPLDTMEIIWTYLFKNYSRNADGQLVKHGPSMSGDRDAVAIVAGAPYAYVDNQKIEIRGGVPLEIDNTLYVPLPFVSQAFGLKVDLAEDGGSAVVHAWYRGKFGIAKNNYLMSHDNRLVSLRQPVREVDGQLYVPIQSFVELVLGKHVSSVVKTEGYEPVHAMYISNYHNQLGDDTARALKYILTE